MLLTACKDEIVHNLSEYEANKLITALHETQIDASKVKQADGKWALSVSSGSAVEALTHLDNLHFFKKSPSIGKDKASLMSSREQQRFQFERSLSLSIETTLSALEGVLDARVHLNLPVSDPLFGKPINAEDKGSASVLLITASSFTNSNEQIASLVAGASGISNKNVAVLVSVKSKKEKQEVLVASSERMFEENFLEDQHEELAFTPINGAHLKYPIIENKTKDIIQIKADFYQNKLWIVVLGAFCLLGVFIKLFFRRSTYAKKPEKEIKQTLDKQITKPTFKGIKPDDFANAIRNVTQ